MTSLNVLVASWLSATAQLADTRGVVEVVPGSGQMGPSERLTREISALPPPTTRLCSLGWPGKGFGL